MDMSLKWKYIYLITCFRQGFPCPKFTLNSVTQLHAELLAAPGNSLALQQAKAGKADLRHWSSWRARETWGPQVQRDVSLTYHQPLGATLRTSSRCLGWSQSPRKSISQRASPGCSRAAALARNLWAGGCTRTPSAGREGSSQGCRGGVLCCQDSSCNEGVGLCVWGGGSGRKPSGSIFPTKHDSGCHSRDPVAPLKKAKKSCEDQPTFSETARTLLCLPFNSILACVWFVITSYTFWENIFWQIYF